MHRQKQTVRKSAPLSLLLLLAVALATPAFGDWEELEPVPAGFQVRAGTAITYGDGRIWGVFHDTADGGRKLGSCTTTRPTHSGICWAAQVLPPSRW